MANRQGINARVKEKAVVIDGKVYSRDLFGDLPHGLRIENVGMVQTPDGTAFQGHLSFLSNFYPCVLKDSFGNKATSAEQLFAIRMAIYNEASRDSVRDQDNPYALKQITRSIKKSKQWEKDAPEILAEIVELLRSYV